MPPRDRHQQPLRLSRQMAARLRKQAEQKSISQNTYVQLALEERLRADEAHHHRFGDRRERDSDRDAPRGLGLRLPSRRPEPEPLPSPEEPVPSVVVNVGSPGGPAPDGSLLGGLAAYVLGGPTFSRDQRLRAARDIVRVQGRTPAEQKALVERLDQVLAAEQEKQRAARPGFDGIGSLFR